MPDFQCTILHEDPVVKFAEEELRKYAEQVTQAIPYTFVLGTYQDFTQRNLMVPSFNADGPSDAFQVFGLEEEIYIAGSNPRSVLFGVYHACKKLFGYKWVSFFREDIKHEKFGSVTPELHSGKMKRRGLVVENYDDTEFLLQLIDWAAKQYINELFFTFMLWDKVKDTVQAEIEKRGLAITLGGHSMHYLLQGASTSAKKQIDFSDDSWKSHVISRIEDYYAETPSIKRVSLWPADVGVEDNRRFLANYIEFTEQLQKQLPDVHVEHIAYNAGLAWGMLELPDETVSSKEVGTLFAYWGRNYGDSFSKEERAYEALRKWRGSAKDLTVFEYYSDHFMLGDLFPPLFHRIRDDIELYSKLGIEQIVNLIVPYIPKVPAREEEKLYPWKTIQLMNSYFFARLSWGDSFEESESDFYSIFGEDHIEVKKVLENMEMVLSEVSKWNVPLFPSRVIDPEQVNAFTGVDVIVKDIKRWKQEIEQLNRKPVTNIAEPFSLISFYVYFIGQKMDGYLSKWEEKVSG